MADKGNKLGLNITIPNNEALLSTYDSEKDAWVIHVQVNEPVDELTGNIRMITQEHHEIHEGDHYFIQNVADLALNEVLDMQFTTPNTPFWTHMVFEIYVEAETEWFIYEGAVINTAGTAVIPRNNNRNSPEHSGNTVATIENANVAAANADTAVAGATTLAHGILGAGRQSGVHTRENEIILRENTVYCFRAVANTAGFINFLVEYYEHAE